MQKCEEKAHGSHRLSFSSDRSVYRRKIRKINGRGVVWCLPYNSSSVYFSVKPLARARQLLFRTNMHGSAFDGQHGFAQTLAERGMRVDGLDDFVGGQFAAHGNGEFADQVSSVGTND